jgi:hypothetical protein
MYVGRAIQIGSLSCRMIGVYSNTCTVDATFTEVIEWLRVLISLTGRLNWVLILPCLEWVASLTICGIGLTSTLVLSYLILMHCLPSVVVFLFFL